MSEMLAVVAAELARGGVLRVAINLGNPVLAQQRPDGVRTGLSVRLAEEVARRLGVALVLTSFKTANDAVEALAGEEVDMGFLAIDPQRAERIAYTAPYIFIEGAYLVRSDSPFHDTSDVDKPGIRIATGLRTAYDLFLTRTIRAAEIVRGPTSAAAIDLFLNGDADVAAGVRQPLTTVAQQHSDLRVLPDSFQTIAQAVAVRKDRQRSLIYLSCLVDALLAEGFIENAQTHA
ncbi:MULTISPECIES: transporter substrate-binding domain-containing protein [Alphaproteobacteria]|nr:MULTISPECIES: transporter substrate-binding domain-containing protein [Alphaproteobacteria]